MSANESYQSAESEIKALTGVQVSHSTQQRLVMRQELPLPLALQTITEVSVDGGKVRLRGPQGEGSYWRDYKAVRLQSLYYAAFFQDNQSLIDYVNSQPLTTPLVCLGDGHDGIWNLVAEFGCSDGRWEILDWYHLRENLYKVGGSLKRLKQAESLLWQGQVAAVIELFSDFHRKTTHVTCVPTTTSASFPNYQLRLFPSRTIVFNWFWGCRVGC